jgi:uncharacterized protein (TIGR03435 family)
MIRQHRRFFVAILVATAGIVGRPTLPLVGQSATAVRNTGTEAFEVASVKVTSARLFAMSPYGQGRFSIRSASLTLLIGLAYDVSEDQISGGPSWRDSEYYDVTARAEDGIALTYDELRPRLQHLLAQRFKLAIHREPKPLQGYALVVAKGGARLKRNNAETSRAFILPDGLRAPSISMDVFAGILARPVGRPVVNETGLDGTYEIALNYAPEGVSDSLLPSIFTALQEQLGLRLESRTVSVESIVIDRVEHPTED